jgi:hypothetical protein
VTIINRVLIDKSLMNDGVDAAILVKLIVINLVLNLIGVSGPN